MARRGVLLVFFFCSSLFAQQQVPQFHVQPLHPIAELRAEALRDSPPAEQGSFRKPELVELVKLDPSIKLDIHYASTNNFLGVPLRRGAGVHGTTGHGSRGAGEPEAARAGIRVARL
jgi:D-alanyl-D-alanine dipeptidase